MEEIKPTRMELIKRRAQIELAERGKELLKNKRDVLVMEFFKIIDSVMRSREELDRASITGQYLLAIAQAMEGTSMLRSASFITGKELLLDIKGTNIMGISVPVIEKKKIVKEPSLRGYGFIGTSSRIDEIALKFEIMLDKIIELAETETRLHRIGEEIRKTKRRVNALEDILIPKLKKQVKYIRMRLEEMERENFFRLKKVKKSIQKKKTL